MKKTVFILGSLLFMLSIIFFDSTQTLSNPSGAPASNTGSPGDLSQTCARSGCHNGTAADRDGLLSSNIPAGGYIAGQTYAITVSITQSGFSKWGFQVSPQNSSGALLGTLSLTDATRTRFVGTGNKYITHTTAGNAGSPGTTSWSFNWTAPAAGTGDVIFYAATMAANGNGNSSGDSVFKESYVVSEDVTSSIDNVAYVYTPFAYPNPVEGVTLNLNVPTKVTAFQLYDLRGKLWLELPNTSQQNLVSLNISTIPAGVYLLKMKAGTKDYMQRIIRR